MTIERLSFPNGEVLDIHGDLSDQVDRLIKLNLYRAVRLTAGLYPFNPKGIHRNDPLFIAEVKTDGTAICLKPEGVELYNWQTNMDQAKESLLKNPSQFRIFRIPQDQEEYTLIALIISKKIAVPQLKLFEYFFFTPGPSPRR